MQLFPPTNMTVVSCAELNQIQERIVTESKIFLFGIIMHLSVSIIQNTCI